MLKNLTSLPAGFTGTYGVDMEPYPDGFNLTMDSPARDAGASLGASYSSSINSVTGQAARAGTLGHTSTCNLARHWYCTVLPPTRPST